MKYLKILTSLALTVVALVVILLLLSVFKIPGFPFDVRVVQTGSMEPAVPTGSVVITRPADVYEVGDIITFDRKESNLDAPVTHRIIETYVDDRVRYFITKGDANDVADFHDVREDEVLGKALFGIPFIGYLLSAARTSYGFIVLIGLPALMIIWDEIKKIRREMKKKDEVPE